MTDSLDALVAREIVEPGVAPSAVAGVARYDGRRWLSSIGAAGHTGGKSADPESVFDLASITKPFVAVTLARLVERDGLEFRTRLAELVPEARGTLGADASLEALGSHRAGFAAHAPLFSPVLERRAFERASALCRAASAIRAECAGRTWSGDGAPALYSDLGYLLLGAALERFSGLPLDELVSRELTGPLDSTVRSARQWLRAGERFEERVAVTERVAFRGGVLRGVVHDENAWALSGHACSGHAGLFGTATGVLRLGMAMLDAASRRDTSFLGPGTVHVLLRERTDGTLRLGFDGKSREGSSAGPSAGPLTFGHLGFTGTSFWCDPAADTVTVLLTNRVFPSRENLKIREARPLVHEALFAIARSLGGVGGRDITD